VLVFSDSLDPSSLLNTTPLPVFPGIVESELRGTNTSVQFEYVPSRFSHV